MGHDRQQPTPIDRDEYERFREFVKDVHGSVQNNLRQEMENALREYRQDYYDQDDPLTRIESDVAEIRAMVPEGKAESDGGATVETPHTRAQPVKPDEPVEFDGERPEPNQPLAERAKWLLSDFNWRPKETLPEQAIRTKIQKEYTLGERSTESMVKSIREQMRQYREEAGVDVTGEADE